MGDSMATGKRRARRASSAGGRHRRHRHARQARDPARHLGNDSAPARYRRARRCAELLRTRDGQDTARAVLSTRL